VHSGLNKVYHEYCDKTPGLATSVLARTSGYCDPKTLEPKSSEEILEALENTAIVPDLRLDAEDEEIMPVADTY
jgi:hypothetical protein